MSKTQKKNFGLRSKNLEFFKTRQKLFFIFFQTKNDNKKTI